MAIAHPLATLPNQGPAAALTTQLTTITLTDAHTPPDYAVASLTNSSAWGFTGEDEAITFTYVVQNLQVRVAELEARLQTLGLIL